MSATPVMIADKAPFPGRSGVFDECWTPVMIDGHGAAAVFVTKMREDEPDSPRSLELVGRMNRIIAIVKAHDALVAALRDCLPFIDDAEDVHSLFPESAASTVCRATVQNARTALRAAGVEP